LPTDLQTAYDALREGRAEEAARALKEHLWRDPNDATAYAALGAALARMGDLEGAILACERAHYLRPVDPDLLYNYGMALKAAARDGDARLRFEAALRLDPGHAATLQQIAGPPSADVQGALPLLLQAPEPPQPRSPAALEPRPQEPPSEAADLPVKVELVEPPSFSPPFTLPHGLPPGWSPEPNYDPNWEPETVPGFVSLARAAMQLWSSQPLVWLALLSIPNAAAAVFTPLDPELQLLTLLGWVAALGLATGPVVTAVAGQWVHGRPLGEPLRLTNRRWLRGTGLALPYLALLLAPLGVHLGYQTRLPAEGLLLCALLLTVPFHALFAPALVMAATTGPGGLEAVKRAAALAGKRTWLHLGVMAAVGLLLGGALAAFAWAFGVTLAAAGDSARRFVQVIALSLAESAWVVLVTLCGLDAISVAAQVKDDGGVAQDDGGVARVEGGGARDEGGRMKDEGEPIEIRASGVSFTAPD